MILIEDRQRVSELFENYQWNYLAEAILNSHHGEVLVDDPDSPNIAALRLPDLNLMILGGDPSHPAAREYIASLPGRSFLMFAER